MGRIRRDGWLQGGGWVVDTTPTHVIQVNKTVCPSTFQENEPCTDDLEVNYDYFHDNVWPSLASRVPKFECLKVRHPDKSGQEAAITYYDVSYFHFSNELYLHFSERSCPLFVSVKKCLGRFL